MSAEPYQWLSEILADMLPDLEHMGKGQRGHRFAAAWFQRLLARFERRGLTTSYQQRNHVVSTRNAIRSRFGNDHASLEDIRFPESVWQQINLEAHDRAEARSMDQLFIQHPNRIVDKGVELLSSPRMEDVAVGLGVATGRRFTEVLDGAGVFAYETPWSVRFSGQRKRGNRSQFDFEVPTLAPADLVIEAYKRLCVMVGSDVRSPQALQNRYNTRVNAAADSHFSDILPVPAKRDTKTVDSPDKSNWPDLAALEQAKQEVRGSTGDHQPADDQKLTVFIRLFRAAYATIAVHYYAPPRVNRITYMAEIQGHRQDLESLATPQQRRDYTSSRYYDYYKIADDSGTNIDGRQGVMLDKLPGLKVIAAFSHVPLDLTPATSHQPPPIDLALIPADPMPSLGPKEPTTPPDSDETTMSTPEATPAKDNLAETLTALDLPPVPKVSPRRTKDLDSMRVHPEDKQWMEAARKNHPTKISQHDFLHRLLVVAAAALPYETDAKRVPKLESDLATALQQVDEFQTKLSGHTEGIGKHLAEILTVIRSPRDEPATLPGIATELLDLALEAGEHPLKDRLISLARRTLGGDSLKSPLKAPVVPVARPAGSATPGVATPAQPSAAKAPISATSTPSSQKPAGDANNQIVPSGGNENDSMPSGDSTPPTPRPGSVSRGRRGGAAYDRVGKAVQGVIAYNNAQTSKDKKWCITETFISAYTGSSRPGLQAYFADHKEEIEAHNLQHDLTSGYNSLRRRNGGDIKKDIPLTPDGETE